MGNAIYYRARRQRRALPDRSPTLTTNVRAPIAFFTPPRVPAAHTPEASDSLPKTDALLRRQIHLVTFLDPEGVIERGLVHLGYGAANGFRRVRIGFDADDESVGTRLAAPR